jgi:O-antigen/teichoic acid export membrane protein
MTQDLARSAGVALSWRAVQQVGVKLIYLVRLLVLARILSPEEFGLLAIAAIAIHFLMHVTNFGMVPALVQRSEADPTHFDSAWTVGMLRATAITALVALAAPLIADIFGEPRSTNIIRVLALQPVIQASASIGIVRLTRDFQFRTLAILWIFEALANSLISIVLAFSFGVWALRFDAPAIADLIRFGRWIFVTSLIALAGRTVLQATISRQLGVAELGLYTLAVRLAFLPADISGAVVGSVAFPLFSRLQNEAAKTAQAFRTLFTGLMALIVPIVGLLMVLASPLVEHVLSDKWEGTAPVIGLLAIASAIGIFGDVAAPMFEGAGQPRLVTFIESVQSLLLVIFALVLAGAYGLMGAASAWVPALTGSMLFCVLLVHRRFPACLEGTGRPLVMIVIAAVAGSAAAWFLERSIGGFGGFAVAAIGGFSIASFGILASDRILGLGMVESLIRVFPRASSILNPRWLRT